LVAQAQQPDAAQQPAAPAPAPTLSIAAREVLLDVVVLDHAGHPVTGLTAADFKLTEEGEVQRLAHLEEHRPMSAEETAALKSAPPLPANTFTNFTPIQNSNAQTVILLDALDTRLDVQMELREQLIDAIKHLPSGTPVAIFRMDTDMRLVQGFTTDMQVLLEAAKSKRDQPSLSKLVRGSREEYLRARGETLSEGFQMIGRYLAGFPGRKNLIWLTGSLPTMLLADPTGQSFDRTFRDEFSIVGTDDGELTDALTLSRVAVYPVEAQGLRTPPIFEAGNNGNGSPSGVMSFEAQQGAKHIGFNVLAESTGGKAFYNGNGLKNVIAGIVGNGSNYYTLAYATTNKTWNGQFRHIKLTVDRPGVQLQNRQGYFAVDRDQLGQRLLAARQKLKNSGKPFADEEAAAQTGMEGTGALVQHPQGGFRAAMGLGVVAPTEVILTASLAEGDQVIKPEKKVPLPPDNYLEAEYRGKPFRMYTVQILADARGLRLTQSANGMRHGSVEFVTLLLDPTGSWVNSQLTTAALNLNEEHYRRILASGLPVKQQIAVPVKGNFFLRVGVHDAVSDHIGAIEIPVDQVRPGVAGQGLQP
jgi:VWFA-related protein